MKIISVKLPEAYVEKIDKLVKEGRFMSRSELIRYALMDFFRKEEGVGASANRIKILLGP